MSIFQRLPKNNYATFSQASHALYIQGHGRLRFVCEPLHAFTLPNNNSLLKNVIR